jgi:hypothetical protein
MFLKLDAGKTLQLAAFTEMVLLQSGGDSHAVPEGTW